MEFVALLKKNNLKENFICFLVCLYLFFWDVKIIGNFGLREFIVISLFPLIYNVILDRSFFKKNKKNLSYILSFIFLIAVHQILNSYFDGLKYISHNFLGLAGISFLTIFIFFYYKIILENIDLIIKFFSLILIISYLFSEIKPSSAWEMQNLCATYFKFDNKLIFLENSHLGMMLGPVFGYYLYIIREKNIYFLIFFYSFVLLFIYFEPSTTFYYSLIVSIILVSIFDFKFFIKKNVFLLLTFLSLVYILNLNKNCFFKISHTFKGFDDIVLEDSKFKKFDDTVLKDTKYKKKDITNKSKQSPEIQKKCGLNENYYSNIECIKDFPLNNYNLKISLNLSSAVFLNSLNIALETVLTRPLGWGLNRYQNAFEYYMFNHIVVPYLYREVYTLNYNDGSANLSKLFTEFGLLIFLIAPFIIYFVFSKKMSNEKKIFFLAILITQLIRGAGYFNGGFLFSMIIIFFTIFNIKRHE